MQSKLSRRLAMRVRRHMEVALLLKIIAILTAMLTGAMIARAHQKHGPLTTFLSQQK